MEAPVKNCTNCNYHYGKKSLDDVPNECYPCIHAEKTLGFYPNWEPIVETQEIECGWQLGPIDNVNSPKHYTQGGIETIDYIKAKLGKDGTAAYCIGNVIKYVSRWKDKNGFEDLAKARWYLNYAVDLLDEQ